MALHGNSLRALLSDGPKSPRQLIERMGISQPTLSRSINDLEDEIVRLGAARSIQYALRDIVRGIPDVPVFRVDAAGMVRELGTLIPVRPEGFVMRQADGVSLYSEGLPWWLSDMRPQGYLGRAYAARHGAHLGLPPRLGDWSDSHCLRALLMHGYDVVGNLLLGEAMRESFLSLADPEPVLLSEKAEVYAKLAHDASGGEVAGTSAGGEQPKFTIYAETTRGPRHLIVKFSEMEDSPVSERWRDLLLAEHLALECLREAGISSSQSEIFDSGGRRYLEVVRFDRVGNRGRRALHSLAALDMEFVGLGVGGWPVIARRLADAGHIEPEALDSAYVLWAFGSLIGNTDMHGGNLSFVAEHGRPYQIAPAYDMTPMAFSPRAGGGLPDSIAAPNFQAIVPNAIWRRSLAMAQTYLARLQAYDGFSPRFGACISALQSHIEAASTAIARLG